MDMVREKNNRSSKLPDQSEGSGRTWLILYVSNTQVNISQYPEPKNEPSLLPPEGQCFSVLSSVMFLWVMSLSTAGASVKEETCPSSDNSRAGGSRVSLEFNESEMQNSSRRQRDFPFSLMAGLRKWSNKNKQIPHTFTKMQRKSYPVFCCEGHWAFQLLDEEQIWVSLGLWNKMKTSWMGLPQMWALDGI